MKSSTRTTEYRYNPDGKLVELTLRNEATGDEVTRWEYGVTKAESGIASNELLRAKIYPDSDDGLNDDGMDGTYDRVEYRYNQLGEIIEQKDQNGTVHQYDYDNLGRLVGDRVPVRGEGIDETILSIGRTYDAKGQVEKVTSYAGANLAGVLNEVKFEYDGYGQVTKDWQEHNGAVDEDSRVVEYAYEEGGETNTARLLQMVYGRTLGYDYGTAGSIDDLMDRVHALVDGEAGPLLARYTKRGVNATVRVEYVDRRVELTYIKELNEPVGDAGDQYTGLDRFNRIEDIRWINRWGETAYDVDRYQYGFDRAGNRRWRRNVVAANLALDEAYAYDGLYQLTGLERGNLNVNRTTVGGIPAWDEAFDSDQAGNWQQYVTKVSGAVTLDQMRRHNRANEITFIDGSNAQVGYDAAGNMTRMPKAGDWDTAQTNTWDAWNRLVQVEEGEAIIGGYAYDGLTRRISKTSTTGVTEITRHGYFSTQWQLLEESLDTEDPPERTFIWGMRYIDDLVLRDCASSTPSRIYVTHDQWHVTGLLNEEGGDAIERFCYSAFGASTVMNAEWIAREDGSAFEWEFRFGVYQYDRAGSLYLARRRYYNAGIGRWISRDPWLEEDGSNLYLAFKNNPLAYVDFAGTVAVLSYKEVTNRLGTCGDFEWTIDWIVKGIKSGFIYQTVKTSFLAELCSGEAALERENTVQEGWAWPAPEGIPAGDTWKFTPVGLLQAAGLLADGSSRCKGRIRLEGTAFVVAKFVTEGWRKNPELEDPAKKEFRLAHYAGPPPNANSPKPAQDGVSNVVVRRKCYEWNCCKKVVATKEVKC